jgi:hypothetical protein
MENKNEDLSWVINAANKARQDHGFAGSKVDRSKMIENSR